MGSSCDAGRVRRAWETPALARSTEAPSVSSSAAPGGCTDGTSEDRTPRSVGRASPSSAQAPMTNAVTAGINSLWVKTPPSRRGDRTLISGGPTSGGQVNLVGPQHVAGVLDRIDHVVEPDGQGVELVWVQMGEERRVQPGHHLAGDAIGFLLQTHQAVGLVLDVGQIGASSSRVSAARVRLSAAASSRSK